MILIDTSVWIEHLRRGSAPLIHLLESREAATHPWVIGELACGNLRNRSQVLTLLGTIPSAAIATHGEILHAIDTHRLMGRGIGYVDAALVASALLSGCRLWSLDRRLARVAAEMGLAHLQPPTG